MSELDTMGDRGPSDPRLIFETLTRHGVDFVAIGGWAVIGHGSTRNTRDVDFVAATDDANLARLEAALAELRAELWGVDAHLLGIDLDARTLAEGGNFTLVTRAGGLDFFNEVPGGAPYEEVRAHSVVADLGEGLQVRIAGINDLIAMKRAAGRPQDLRDIATLTHIERERRGG
jgi:predicted nucleotidyltransferase